MEYHTIGLAFCKGLKKEAKVVAELLRSHGFVVVSVICKTGGIPKETRAFPKIRKSIRISLSPCAIPSPRPGS